MAFSDPIADLLTRIRNAKIAKNRYVDIDLTKLKLNIVKILKQKGFVDQFLVDDEKRKLRIFLKYNIDRESIITGLRRISSPGLRRYVGYQDIPRIMGGLGMAIVSTSQGVVDGETARKQKLGGELLCLIW